MIKDISIGELPVEKLYQGNALIWERTHKIPTDYVLRYDFNGDTVDKSSSGLNGIKTGAITFQNGRKVGSQCADFINGCVYTPSALPINSDKVTVSLWANIRSLGFSCLLEMSTNAAQQKGFASFISDVMGDTIEVFSGNQDGINLRYIDILSFLDTWVHFIFTIDNSQASEAITTIYINNMKTNSLADGYTGMGGFNFVPNIFYIGQRAASGWSFNGQVQDLRIYNRVLTKDERTALFNE